jgi:hypothetical protein
VCEVTAKMNAIPKMDKFCRKCIFLGEVAKVGGGYLVLVPKPLEDTGVMKIAKGIKIDGPEGKSGRASPQRA